MAETICPKCGHQRQADAISPNWQCPQCGIAYHKYRALLERSKLSVARPRPADTDVLREWRRDNSLWTLLAANLLVLVFAIFDDWSLASLMMLYWSQSVVIGFVNVIRMRSLERFSTTGFTINDRQPPETKATAHLTSWFFVMHYGSFHAIYLLILITGAAGDPQIDVFLMVSFVAFAVNHWFSLHYNIEVDRQGKPNIGTLMFTPYLRIIPMHLMIILGSVLGAAGFAIAAFIVLKTLADAGMHLVEHRNLSAAGNGRRKLPG